MIFYKIKPIAQISQAPGGQNKNLKKSIKGILYDFEKKNEQFYFSIFDENLLSAWFKDESPQGLSWQSALKDIIPFYDKNIKSVFPVFFLVKMVLVLFKGTRTQNLIWKNPLKGYCMILKKMKNFIFSILWWKSVVGAI